MSNLGMKIEASGFEVGFKAETREEFDSYLARLTLFAATIWPTSTAAQPDDEHKTPASVEFDEASYQKKLGGNYAEQRKAATDWREGQGLR